MTDTFDLNASIKNYGQKGVVLFLKGRGLNACTMTQKGREILIKLCKRSSNELLPNWPVPDNINDRYYKLSLELESGAMISRLPASVVQSILESGTDSFDLMIRGHSKELKVECLKQGSISKDQALGNEVNFTQEYVETEADKDSSPEDSTPVKENTLAKADATFANKDASFNHSTSQVQNNNNKNIFLIAGLALLAALILAAIIYFMFFFKSADSANTSNEAVKNEQVLEEPQADTAQPQDDSKSEAQKSDAVDTSAQTQASGNVTASDASANAADTTVVVQGGTADNLGKCSVANGYDSSVIAQCAKEGSREEIIGFIKQAVADNKCESAVNVLLYRSRNEKSDPTFAFKLAQFYDSKSSLSLPCLNKDDKAAMYYYEIAKKLQGN